MTVSSRSNLTLSERIVRAIATAEGVDPRDLDPPLHDVVDPEALDGLFDTKSDGKPRPDGQVSFEYAEYEVFVSWPATVDVTAKS